MRLALPCIAVALLLAWNASGCTLEPHSGEVGAYPTRRAPDTPGAAVDLPHTTERSTPSNRAPTPAKPGASGTAAAVTTGQLTQSALPDAGAPAGSSVASPPAWPSGNYDSANTRYNPNESALSPWRLPDLRLVWSTDFSAIAGTPAVYAGRFYVCDEARFYSGDTQTGELSWETETSASGVCGSPLVNGDKVYFAHNGRVAALDRSDGTQLWSWGVRTDVGQTVAPSPILAGDKLVVEVQALDNRAGSLGGSGVVALAAEDGSEVWRFLASPNDEPTLRRNPSSLAYDDERQLVFLGTRSRRLSDALGGAVLALDAATGQLVWSQALTPNDAPRQASCRTGVEPSCIEHGVIAAPNLFSAGGVDAVGVGTLSGTYIAFERSTGMRIWEADLDSDAGTAVTAVAAVGEGAIYVSRNDLQDDTSVFALDPNNGQFIWEAVFDAASRGGLTLAHGVLYFPTARDGMAHALDARTGEVMWSADLGGDAVVGFAVVGGMLFAPTSDVRTATAARAGAALQAFAPRTTP
jgi:polyvinyl alcohol dehydrogenase (cytochrome)